MILAFVTLGAGLVYQTGHKQQRNARFYTDCQTELREGLRRITRTIRHSSGVKMGTSFSPADSSSTQVIVQVPMPNSNSTEQIRIYRDSTTGNIYGQRTGEATGTLLMSGPSAMTINYYQTTVTSTGTSLNPVDGTPGSATEIQITLSATRSTMTTTSVAYTALRNATLGF